MHQLHAFGSNGSGQLGLGHEEDCSEPQFVDLGNHTKNTSIRAIAAGGNHTLLLLDNGTVLTSGSNEQGQCGERDDSSLSISRFTPIPHDLDVRAKQIAATWTTSTFVSFEEQIYVTGTGLSGELGLGKDVKQVFSPTLLPDFPAKGASIVSLSSCMAHTVAVLSTGEVYGWGNGRKGQLGEPSEHVWQPRRIEDVPFRAKRVACGKDFTCVLGTRGEVLTLGPNKLDRFGINANTPARASGLMESANVVASWGTVILSTVHEQKLEYQAWGRDDHGQKPPQTLPPLRAICSGSEHFLAVSTSGQVVTWGWGEHGNCATPVDDAGDVKGKHNVVNASNPLAVFAGCATSFIVTDTQSVLRQD